MTQSPQPGEILTLESEMLGSSPAAIPTVQADDPVAGDKATGAQAVIRDGKIVISVDVDALPLIVSGSCCISDGLSGLWSVTDANLFAKEVCTSLNREREDGTTPVHAMFDKAFAHAINQGAEGIESVSEDEFEAVASQLQQTALATTAAETGTVGMERGNAVRNEPKSTEPDVAAARELLLGELMSHTKLGIAFRLILSAYDRQGEEIERLRGDLESMTASRDVAKDICTEKSEIILELRGALEDLLTACEADFGVPDEGDEDDEPVATGENGWKSAITFGLLRRARQGGPDHG